MRTDWPTEYPFVLGELEPIVQTRLVLPSVTVIELELSTASVPLSRTYEAVVVVGVVVVVVGVVVVVLAKIDSRSIIRELCSPVLPLIRLRDR
jgi:hypothetical protein